eukprot:PhM_4_TR17961/c0_g1_i1/m.76685/K13989/DERL2_3; Derlin-2/3
MGDFELDRWYFGIPVITRTYMTLCTLTAACITFQFLTPLTLYLNWSLVFEDKQYWRLVTNFLFFDAFGINFLFHMHFLYMYFCRLEEHYFHRRTADFFFMLLFGATSMLAAAYVMNILFLSFPFLLFVLYVWCRRNPEEDLHILGLVPVSAPYIPYVFVLLSLVLGHSLRDDLLGIFVGHVYWYLADIVPRVVGFEVMRTPFFIRVLFPNDLIRR